MAVTMTAMAARLSQSQLSCFGSINRHLPIRVRSVAYPNLRPKLSISMSVGGRDTDIASSQTRTTSSYTADASKSHVEGIAESVPTIEEHHNGKVESSGLSEQHIDSQPQRAAKIHDFCFGIPFGGFVLSGGIVGFIFSRNPATLSAGVLFGGALLALSTLSLKIWKQGKSSLPFILGQAALAAALLWKNFQAYTLTKKIFPTGLYAFFSATMLSFYFYVVASGGNPPPKKKPSAAAAT